MARTMDRLNDLAVRRATRAGVHSDGGGLYLQVSGTGSKSWLFRYTFRRKPRWMGLGPYPAVSLATARKKAATCRQALAGGADPIEQRREENSLARQSASTFRQCAADFIVAQRAGWRNVKHAAQWTATLETYAMPVFGDAPVSRIDTEIVLKALRQIWEKKPETATRLRQRIEAVIDWAIAHGYRQGTNPARWRGHLDKLLPRRSKVRAVAHHPAMPYAQLPAFYLALRNRETTSALALAFTIVTAARSGEVRMARWSEMDLEARLWTVPPEHTKTRRPHRVALSSEAVTILGQAAKLRQAQGEAAAVFPGAKAGEIISENTMLKCLHEDLELPELTVHGFRSTFRDWSGEQTSFPRELAEAALAHVLKDKSEAAYARTDLFERRRALMEAWARYCASATAAGEVVPLRRTAVAPS